MNVPTPAAPFLSASDHSATFDVASAPASGNPMATAALLRTVAPKLKRFVRAVLGATHPDVEDAEQQALIGFVQALPAFRGDCDPVGYARVIAVRVAIEIRRRARERGMRCDDGASTEEIEEPRPSPGEALASERRKQILRDLLLEMRPEQAESLALRVVFGCSLEEVALQTGVPLNTVRSRIRLAKEHLKERIESDPTLMSALALGE